MDRVLRGTAATISATISVDGTATDPSPDTATVKITRDDGTILVAAGTSATNAGTGKFTFTLTPAHTALLDALTVDWTATISGQAQTLTTHVEVVGGFLFSIADARALKPLDNTTDYPTDKIVAARTLAEEAIEDACGVAFVPRYVRETVDGSGTTGVSLGWPRTSVVRSISLDGTVQSATTDVKVRRSGILYRSNGWDYGSGNYSVAYEHGWPYPPARISRAALLLAKRWLVEGPYDDRATSMSTEDGTFSLVTPGLRGAMFDLPEVNAAVEQYGYRVAIG